MDTSDAGILRVSAFSSRRVEVHGRWVTSCAAAVTVAAIVGAMTDAGSTISTAALRLRLCEVLSLKALPRAGWVRVGIEAPESVAAHSWGVAWLVLLLAPPALDRGRALEIAILHDLGEVRIGDITPFDGVTPEDKRSREEAAITGLLEGLPRSASLRELWLEYEEQSSPEGRFVKACDRLDMALQAHAYAAQGDVDVSSFIRTAVADLPEGLLAELASCGS